MHGPAQHFSPATLNAQGPAIQVLITENGAHYQQLASLENEGPFAEAHPTKHSLEPSIPWDSTQAANGAFSALHKGRYSRGSFLHLCVRVCTRNGSLTQCRVGSIVPCFSLADWSHSPELPSPHMPSMLFPGVGQACCGFRPDTHMLGARSACGKLENNKTSQ